MQLGLTSKAIRRLRNNTKINFSNPLPQSNEEPSETKVPPRFTTSFGDHNLEQGSIGHFEANLEPKDDSNIVLEWKLNGKPLMQSKTKFINRIKSNITLNQVQDLNMFMILEWLFLRSWG